MKCIIAGSRGVIDYQEVVKALQAFELEAGCVTEVVSGGAPGVDRLGERWAAERKLRVVKFIPDWTGEGKGAGFIRNRKMAQYAEALVAIWDGQSKGTAHMVQQARKHGLKVHIHIVP